MLLNQQDYIKLKQAVSFCTAKLMRYVNDREGAPFGLDKKLSLRKAAIARTAIDAMSYILSKANGDANPPRPTPCESKANSQVVSGGGSYQQYQYDCTFKIKPLPLPLQEDFALKPKVIYLEYIEDGKKSRVGGAPPGSSFVAPCPGDDSYPYRSGVRYLCHLLDSSGGQHYCWLSTAVQGVVVNQGCSFLQTMTGDLLHRIIANLSQGVHLEYKPPTVRMCQYSSEYLDNYTCPDLLPEDEDSTAAEKYALLKQCCQALQRILINLDNEHNRQNLASGKTYIPAKSLDGKPALELPGASFWAKAFSHSESMLHTVCRECWQMVEVCVALEYVETMANPAFGYQPLGSGRDSGMCTIA